MLTDQRTGQRSITAARETYAALALTGLTAATVLRCLNGRPGGFAGTILTVIALAILSRFRVSWDKDGISYQNPFWSRRKRWTELSAYSIEPGPQEISAVAPGSLARRRFGIGQASRLRLHGYGFGFTIGLLPYSMQDIRHLTDAVARELAVREEASAVVS